MGKVSGDRLGSTGRGSAHLVLSSGKQRISNNKKESLFVQDVNSNKASHYRLSFAEIQSQSREWKVPLKNGWLRMLYLKVWAWWSQRKTNWKYGIMSYVIGFVNFHILYKHHSPLTKIIIHISPSLIFILEVSSLISSQTLTTVSTDT